MNRTAQHMEAAQRQANTRMEKKNDISNRLHKVDALLEDVLLDEIADLKVLLGSAEAEIRHLRLALKEAGIQG